MAALHQRTRRRLCQIGFCLLCALPTTGLLAWSVGLRTASHQQRCKEMLSERLGFDVRFEQISYPQPGLTRFEEFELADAESGESVVRCRSLDVLASGDKIAIEPHEVDLAAQHAEKLRRLVTRRLAHEIPGDAALALIPTQVTITSGDAHQTYDDVSGRIELTDDATATLRFRLPEYEAGEPPLFSISRHSGESGMRTTSKLATLGAALPVAMLTPWLDLTDVLGDDATFQGTITIDEDANRWVCQATGVLAEVDLERLVARRFPHHLTGRATIDLTRARLEAGRVIEAAGTLRSPSGTVGSSLLAAAADWLGCQPRSTPAGTLPYEPGRNDQYRDLALVFQIDEQGIALNSSPSAQPPGALILSRRGAALLTAPIDGPVPLVQFVRALAPESELLVPATKETSQLVRWLPLPPVMRASDEQPGVPPLRMPE